ncbi:MAG: transcriptional repressor [Duncaniella sp.]|uniref:Fur family transcriptional regulator n=1 Tax=Duncaniella sp. TaxID=2518496 RepID=UPI00198B6F36|nr:Fur family transcriptional regulator [Duncaniella sp.]MBD5334141.1 transcriptional repressor [Bacteroides sp.]MDE6090017.1 transcriptional repressor [Duncaniella sp.]
MQTYIFTTQEILDLLSDAGVKPSAQRMTILRYLMENRIHPTVDEIFKSLLPDNPTLSRTTVYNTLRLLEASGIIRSIGTGGGDGTRWDYSDHDHGHFLCTSCGHVTDVDYDSASTSFTLPPEGYTVHSADVIFKGICPECSGALK